MRRSVKYNDVDNYRYLTILGVTGAYIEAHIQEKTLPGSFFHYELQKSKDRTVPFAAIGKKIRFDYCGDFITKEELDLPKKDSRCLTISEWSFQDTVFQFEEFFGMKLSINKQIQDAEAKRDMMQKKQASEDLDVKNDE